MLIVPPGRAIPVRFALRGACAGATNVPARLYLTRTDSGWVGPFHPALSDDSPWQGNAFSYNGASGQYLYSLHTAGLRPGAYLLGIDLGDGGLHTLPFAVR
jgi:hypothetical protein